MLFLALQVEFITGFWTPIPAGAGGKLALAWLTGTGKRIAHPVIAQAELQPVLDFLELSEVMSQTSPRCQLAGPCCVRSPDPVVACSEPWERLLGKEGCGSMCGVALSSGLRALE